ncbi:MAG: tRNA pseudouridine(54/55) synthase Pus10 [Candidatus Thorarchaeota archaeon]
MTPSPQYMILDTALALLEGVPLCDRCLGRQFAWLSTDSSNPERGRSIKLLMSMAAEQNIKSGDADWGKGVLAVLAGHGMFEPARKLAEKYAVEYEQYGECSLCTLNGRSIFDIIPDIVERAAQELETIEFSTFLAGCRPNPRLADMEDELRANYHILYGETLKSDFNREFGKQLRARLGKTPEFQHPDIVVIYDMVADMIQLQISPIFVYGRYRKLQRGIPQSRWDCKACGGKGCEKCGWTGRRYPDSIAEYVGEPMMEAARGTQYKFHAAGREDIDALMLGNGRPFVVEISQPKVRTLDLEAVAREINRRAEGKVEVIDLRTADRELGQLLKKESSENVKEYEALIETEEPVNDDTLKRAEEALHNVVIQQRTPTRVAHRRADKVRPKLVYEVKLKKRDDGLLHGFFRVQGGTYIKELISGDDGRTTPSVAELIGTPAVCVELNVVGIREKEENQDTADVEPATPDHNA